MGSIYLRIDRCIFAGTTADTRADMLEYKIHDELYLGAIERDLSIQQNLVDCEHFVCSIKNQMGLSYQSTRATFYIVESIERKESLT